MIQNQRFLATSFLLLTALAVVAGLSGSLISSAKQTRGQSPGANMSKAAKSFLATLSKQQKAKTIYEFDAKERTGWHFIPKDSRKGLQYKNMSEGQRAAAMKLLASCLSNSGFNKAKSIMQLEGLLNAIEKGRGAIRDPERYYFTVFGDPSGKNKWGLSIEGHHLSLNFVVENNQLVSVSPSFYAANPGEVKTDIYEKIEKGTRVLKAEEVLGFQLVNSLSPGQKSKAIFAAKAPREIRAAGEPQPPKYSDDGIAGKDLNEKQINQLKKLVSTYASNFPEPIAKAKLTAIEQSGWDKVRFAWGGATKPGVGHYYRVQGKTFLIEFVNTQPDAQGNPANHIHCVWRNPNGDFAIELTQ